MITPALGKDILEEMLAEMKNCKHSDSLQSALDIAGSDMLKRMQYVFPLLVQIQMEVLRNRGLHGDGEGLMKFTQEISEIAKEDMVVKKLNEELQNIMIPRKMCLVGQKGEDKRVPVPVGITVTNEDGQLIGELNQSNSELIVARGACGGGPNTRFRPTKASLVALNIDLKLIADISLVGFPNAGKSTLLKGLSTAKPKVGSYPFTTVRPNLGELVYEDERKITVADLPGLIEGAHLNRGMGHRFLKHVERSFLMLLLVDIHGFQLNPHTHFRNAVETVLLLNREMELHNPEMLSKPAVLCLNKVDGASSKKVEKVMEQIEAREDYMKKRLDESLWSSKFVQFRKILPLSAQKEESLLKLKETLRTVLDEIDDELRENRAAYDRPGRFGAAENDLAQVQMV